MKLDKLQQKFFVLCFIVVLNLYLFVFHITFEINQYYYVEETNTYRWQKWMTEEEFQQLHEGMSYMDVVQVAKGRGEQLTEHTFLWKDEQLLMKSYIVTFSDNQLVGKFVYSRHRGN